MTGEARDAERWPGGEVPLPLWQAPLLEELEAAASRIDPGALLAFLDRLDALGAAIEAYANPELVMDHLVLAWPRLSRAA